MLVGWLTYWLRLGANIKKHVPPSPLGRHSTLSLHVAAPVGLDRVPQTLINRQCDQQCCGNAGKVAHGETSDVCDVVMF